MAWNAHTLYVERDLAEQLANIICDIGMDPNYLQIIPTRGRYALVLLECTDERFQKMICRLKRIGITIEGS